MRQGFTLIEIIIVVIIVGIMATFAIPQFAVTKERALDSEAKATLGLMRAAEKIYKMELGGYYGSAIISDINAYLRLSLPAGSSWNYSVASTGVSTATRSGGSRPRTWTLNPVSTCENPTCIPAGTCLSAGGC